MLFQMRGLQDGELWAAAKWRAAGASEGVSYKPEGRGVAASALVALVAHGCPLSRRSGKSRSATRVGYLEAVAWTNQENDASGSTGTIYWEGAVQAFEGDKPIGRGYLESDGLRREDAAVAARRRPMFCCDSRGGNLVQLALLLFSSNRDFR